MQYPYLEVIERLHTDQFRFYYILLEENGQPIAFFYFQETYFFGSNLLPYFPNTEHPNFFRRNTAKFLAFFKPVVAKIRIPMLVAGNIFMTGESGCLTNTDNKEEVYRLQMFAINALSKCNYYRVVLNANIYESEYDVLEIYRKNSFRRTAVEDDNTMDISAFKSYGDYLAALSSKYRVRERRIMKLSQPITSKLLSLEEIELLQYPIYALYKRVADKIDFKLGELDKRFFYEQKKLFPENYFLRAYFLDGNLCGFVSLYTLKNHAEVHYFGIDYTLLKDYHLYQRMLYDTVSLCIEKKLSYIHFGRTAPEVKSTIGAKQIPMLGYLKHPNPLINFIIQLFTSNLKPREYQLRNPFKEGAL